MCRGKPASTPATLSHLTSHGVDVWCRCEACSHSAVLPRAMLIDRLEPDYPVPEIKKVLHWTACGPRNTFAPPNWANWIS